MQPARTGPLDRCSARRFAARPGIDLLKGGLGLSDYFQRGGHAVVVGGNLQEDEAILINIMLGCDDAQLLRIVAITDGPIALDTHGPSIL